MPTDGRSIDERPGAVPDIQADGDSVIFCLRVLASPARLLIRCSPSGEILVSIDGVPPGAHPQPEGENFRRHAD